MTLPLFIGTISGQQSAPQVLSYINNSFLALFSKCLSPIAPEDPIAGMEWINTNTGVWSVRDPQGVAWVPIGKFDTQNWIPYSGAGTGSTGGGGAEDSSQLGPYATLAAGTGFAGGADGEVFVRRITASDLPTVSASAAGITPIPTSAQTSHVLRPTGWSPVTQDFGSKTFANQSAYVWSGFPPVTTLRCVWDITMPGSRVAVVQLGSGGAPKTSGYDSNMMVINRDDDPLASNDYFHLWRDVWDLTSVNLYGQFDITEISPNKYFISGFARGPNSKFLHHQIGFVTLPGPMNYLRITTSGTTPVNITSGSARVLGG